MKRFLLGGLAALTMATTVVAIAPLTEAAFTTAVVSNSGLLRAGRDHYLEVTVKGDPLQRIRVKCVTFHELDGVEIFVDGQKVEPNINFGFEEFTITFSEAIPEDKVIRVLMKNSRVRGNVNRGIEVPYRVFGTYPELDNTEFPLGTAIIRTPGRSDSAS